MRQFLYNVWRMYADGFREMTVGRKLWMLIFIKLAIIFLFFKLLFFPDILSERYDSDAERADAVRHELATRGLTPATTDDDTVNN